jgi:hypothetical protein
MTAVSRLEPDASFTTDAITFDAPGIHNVIVKVRTPAAA